MQTAVPGKTPALPGFRWRYGGADDASDRPGAAAGLDRAKEEQWVREVLGTLNVPVEREVLESVAREQAGLSARLDAAGRPHRDRIAALELDLARDLSPAARKRLELELAAARKRLADSQTVSDVLVVTVSSLPDTEGARVFWDARPAADGRRHLRLVFAKRVYDAPAEANPKDAARKIATHELTHVADFYKSPERFPEQRFIEPRAYRNHVLSYQQEGRPKGSLVFGFGGADHARLAADPVGWMHDQLTRYVREGGSQGGRGLWENTTLDDLRDPAAALAWRLRYAYLNAFADAPQLSGPPRAEHFKKRAKIFEFDDELTAVMLKVDEDPKVPLERKSARFAALGAATTQGRSFVKRLQGIPRKQVAKIELEEREFFDSLTPILR